MKFIDAIDWQVIQMGPPKSRRACETLHSIAHLATLLQIAQIRRKGLFQRHGVVNSTNGAKVCVTA